MSINYTPTAPTVQADRAGISVKAADTLDWTVHRLGATEANALAEAWQHPACLFATSPGKVLTASDLDPGGGWPPGGLQVLDRTGLTGFAHDLNTLGFRARAATVWDDVGSLSFLDEPRRLHLLALETPFTLTAATIVADEHGYPKATVLDRFLIGAGRYLFAETISAAGTRTALHGVWACPGEVTVEALADIEGFDAWQISAGCGECGRSWIACAGSWWFNPDSDDVGNDLEWHYEDSTGHRDDTIDCPIGWCPGRVAFTV